MFIVSKKKYDREIREKNREIFDLRNKRSELELENFDLKKQIKKHEADKKASRTLIEKNSKERKKHLDNLNTTIELLTEANNMLNDALAKRKEEVESLKREIEYRIEVFNTTDEYLQEARNEVVRLSKLVKKESPTVEELKAEKCNKTDLKKLVGRKERRK